MGENIGKFRNKSLKPSEDCRSKDYQIKILEMAEPFLDELRLPNIFFPLGIYHVWAFLRNRPTTDRETILRENKTRKVFDDSVGWCDILESGEIP